MPSPDDSRRRAHFVQLQSFSIADYLGVSPDQNFGNLGGGSLPDLPHGAAASPSLVGLSRDEVARLSSQRRQEVARIREEAELLRSNPLRALRYLYHPAVRVSYVLFYLGIFSSLIYGLFLNIL